MSKSCKDEEKEWRNETPNRPSPLKRSNLFHSPGRFRRNISSVDLTPETSTPVATISPLFTSDSREARSGYRARFKLPSSLNQFSISASIGAQNIDNLSPRTSPRSMSPYPGDFRSLSTPRSQSQTRKRSEQQFVLGPRDSKESSPTTMMSSAELPGLYHLARSRFPQTASPAPIMRQRSAPRHNSAFRPVSGPMTSSITSDFIPGYASEGSPWSMSGYEEQPSLEIVDHRQRIEDLEQQLQDLQARIQKESVQSIGGRRILSNSTGTLGSLHQSGGTSPTTVESSAGYNSAASSLPPRQDSPNSMRYYSMSQEMLETESSTITQFVTPRTSLAPGAYRRTYRDNPLVPGGSLQRQSTPKELDQLQRRLIRTESALELTEANYDRDLLQFRELTASQRQQLDALRIRMEALETECEEWKNKSMTQEEDERKLKESMLKKTQAEVQKLRDICDEIYQEAVKQDAKREKREEKLKTQLNSSSSEMELLRMSLKAKEMENEQLRSEVELMKSELNEKKTGKVEAKEEVQDCRWMIKCLQDCATKMAQGETPDMDKLLGIAEHKEWKRNQNEEEAGMEVMKLKREIEMVQDLFARFSAQKTAQEAGDSCRIS